MLQSHSSRVNSLPHAYAKISKRPKNVGKPKEDYYPLFKLKEIKIYSLGSTEFEVVEVTPEAKMTEVYKKAAEFWSKLRVELLSASAFLTDEKPNNSQLWRLY
ncbi:hypothetical protein Tco_1063039 [Tanacetum coccineum]